MSSQSGKLTKAEKVARSTERFQRSEKRIAQFKKAYAAVGIPVSEETIAWMATQEPVDITCRWTLDVDEQEG